MKLTTYKGFDIDKLPKIIKAIMNECGADSLGNITLKVDLYKDGEKMIIKDDYFKVEQC